MGKIKKILFCTDFSNNSNWAFSYAVDLAKIYKAFLYIIHVISKGEYLDHISIYIPPDVYEKIEEENKRYINESFKENCLPQLGDYKDYEFIIKQGTPFVEIIKFAKEKKVDIIMMGTHGKTALTHVLFGSTAENVVRKAPCPVLTIRHPSKQIDI